MKEAPESRQRKRSRKFARRCFSGVDVRRHVRVIGVIMIVDARRSCSNHRASLVPNAKSGIYGSRVSSTQRSNSKGKDYSLRDSVRSVADRNRPFDLFCDHGAGDVGIQG